jgi:large subunit ribosomal protein L9|tara:strand:+ start:252 stop:881 length:630 start_codon:yes stop_codon:yes gene_type:complete
MFVETVEGSGSMGDVKDVKPGYARNYLLPKGLAVPATPHAVARAEELRKQELERQQVLDEHYRELVNKLTEKPIIIGVRVGEQGRLYGSVNNADIAKNAGEILGEDLDRRRILLGEAIRQVGVYTVQLRLSPKVQPHITVVVVDEESPDGVEAAAQLLLNPPEDLDPAIAADDQDFQGSSEEDSGDSVQSIDTEKESSSASESESEQDI